MEGLGVEHPNYYITPKMVQKGDSGGGVFAAEDGHADADSPRTIYGVVATAYYVTRVELVSERVRAFVE